MKISKITIGRLYNLGNYEHIRYELTVDVKEGESAAEAVCGIEAILSGLKPLKLKGVDNVSELKRAADEIERMKTMPEVEWEQQYGHCKGTRTEVIARYQESLDFDITKTHKAVEHAKRARELFDDLGGVAQWKDAKLDWDDCDAFQEDDV